MKPEVVKALCEHGFAFWRVNLYVDVVILFKLSMLKQTHINF
jgi:hypothetical protein